MIAFESTCQSSFVLKLYVPKFASVFIDKVKKQLMKNFASYDLTENGAAKKRQTNVAKNNWLEFGAGRSPQ